MTVKSGSSLADIRLNPGNGPGNCQKTLDLDTSSGLSGAFALQKVVTSVAGYFLEGKRWPA
jgi:hypothetical protein